MLINGEVYSDDKGEGGYLRIQKVTHRDLRECLPAKGEQLGVKHGEMMSKWCHAPGKPIDVVPVESKKEDLKIDIWLSLYPIYKDIAKKDQLKEAVSWLRNKGILKEEESLEQACESQDRMADIYSQIPIAMGE